MTARKAARIAIAVAPPRAGMDRSCTRLRQRGTVPRSPPPPRRRPGQVAPAVSQMLALQRTIGNRAVAQMLARQAVEAPEPPAEGVRQELRQGAKDENYGYTPHRGAPEEPTRISDPTGGGDVELLQLKLNWHLSAMRRRGLIVDGDFGGATARAVIAFKRFHKMRPANAVVDGATWAALDAAPQVVAPTGRSAQGPAPEYDRITEDGLLQITLAVGFDEHGLTAGRAPRAAARARGGARLHASTRRARRSCTTRRGARRPPRAASCSSRRTWRPRSAAGPLRAAVDRAGRPGRGRHRERVGGGARARRERGVRVRRARALRDGPGLRPELHDHGPLGPGAGAPARQQQRRREHELRSLHAGVRRRRQPPRHRDLRPHARGGAADLHRAPGGQPRHQPRAGHAPRHARQPPDRPRDRGPAAAAGALGDRRPLPPVAVQRLRDQAST